MMTGYDDKNVLLLPPRVPGEGLPPELLEYYKDQNALPPQEDQGMLGNGGREHLLAVTCYKLTVLSYRCQLSL